MRKRFVNALYSGSNQLSTMDNSPHHGFWGQTSEEILIDNFPLHRACRDGDVESLSILLVEAQHGIYIEDSFYGWTPAHWAAYFGKLACLRKLMNTTRIGVDCNIRTSRFKQTPAHLAAFGDQPHCLQWLLQSDADSDLQDYLGETPVHKAARTGSMECVSLLASHGARLYIDSKSGQSPAQLAATCGHVACSQFLEATANRQEESLPKGVYATQSPTPDHVQPSPCDVTTERVPPCVINYGINGGRLPPAQPPTLSVSPFENVSQSQSITGHAMEQLGEGAEIRPFAHMPHQPNCMGDHVDVEHNELLAMAAMEQEEDMEQTDIAGVENFPVNGTRLICPVGPINGHVPSGDITLLKGISTNRIPVAGKKRGREESDEVEHKRMRKNGEIHFTTNEFHSNRDPLHLKDNATQNGQQSFMNQCPQLSMGITHSIISPSCNKATQHDLKSDDCETSQGHGNDDQLDANISDTALEHYSTVLLELGYGDMMLQEGYGYYHGV